MLWRSPQGKLLSLLSTAFPSFRNDSCICDVGIVLTSLATVTKDLTRRNIEEEEFILADGLSEANFHGVEGGGGNRDRSSPWVWLQNWEAASSHLHQAKTQGTGSEVSYKTLRPAPWLPTSSN